MNDKKLKRGTGRTTILKAALVEFSTKGYSGTTTAGIARRAKVTQPLIHHHFSSKRKLWEEVLEDIHSDFKSLHSDAAAKTENMSLLDRMKANLTAYVLFSARHSEIARIIIMESAIGGETYDYLFKTYMEPELEALKIILQEGRDAGLIRDIDPVMLPFLISGAGVHPFVVPQTISRITGLDPMNTKVAHRYAEMIADVLLKGLLKN